MSYPCETESFLNSILGLFDEWTFHDSKVDGWFEEWGTRAGLLLFGPRNNRIHNKAKRLVGPTWAKAREWLESCWL